MPRPFHSHALEEENVSSTKFSISPKSFSCCQVFQRKRIVDCPSRKIGGSIHSNNQRFIFPFYGRRRDPSLWTRANAFKGCCNGCNGRRSFDPLGRRLQGFLKRLSNVSVPSFCGEEGVKATPGYADGALGWEGAGGVGFCFGLGWVLQRLFHKRGISPSSSPSSISLSFNLFPCNLFRNKTQNDDEFFTTGDASGERDGGVRPRPF